VCHGGWVVPAGQNGEGLSMACKGEPWPIRAALYPRSLGVDRQPEAVQAVSTHSLSERAPPVSLIRYRCQSVPCGLRREVCQSEARRGASALDKTKLCSVFFYRYVP
jgi:hypothetical protein